jgi:hypothetical protein
MNARNSRHGQSFYGTLEQCMEQYGGKSRFTVSSPLTFFSGARLETHRRAQSNDGMVIIVERQLGPTTCEVYLQATAMRPQAARPAGLSQSNCA